MFNIIATSAQIGTRQKYDANEIQVLQMYLPVSLEAQFLCDEDQPLFCQLVLVHDLILVMCSMLIARMLSIQN